MPCSTVSQTCCSHMSQVQVGWTTTKLCVLFVSNMLLIEKPGSNDDPSHAEDLWVAGKVELYMIPYSRSLHSNTSNMLPDAQAVGSSLTSAPSARRRRHRASTNAHRWEGRFGIRQTRGVTSEEYTQDLVK